MIYARRSLGIKIDILYMCMGIYAKRRKISGLRADQRAGDTYIACG